jgi:hypothetical protein
VGWHRPTKRTEDDALWACSGHPGRRQDVIAGQRITTHEESASISLLGGAMADELRVMLEMGPKGKQVVAVAADWPGLSRRAKTEEAAIERLRSYLLRMERGGASSCIRVRQLARNDHSSSHTLSLRFNPSAQRDMSEHRAD